MWWWPPCSATLVNPTRWLMWAFTTPAMLVMVESTDELKVRTRAPPAHDPTVQQLTKSLCLSLLYDSLRTLLALYVPRLTIQRLPSCHRGAASLWKPF